MIHLDANVLIRLAAKDSAFVPLRAALARGELLSTSALAWHEFVCGPVAKDEIAAARMMVDNRIVAFDAEAAELGAELFNLTGRQRGKRLDCLIAATALTYEAALYTLNLADFERFEPFGLKLLRE